MSQIPVLVETSLLKPVAMKIVPVRTKPFDVAAFYSVAQLFYHDSPETDDVDSMLEDRLALNIRQIVDLTPDRYVALRLKAYSCDTDIREELPEIMSTVEDIVGFIEKQPGGKQGFLLNNGHTNIFYIEGKDGEVFAVGVVWIYSHWGILVGRLDEDFEWQAGDRVICPGTTVL